MGFSKIRVEPPGPKAKRVIGTMKNNCYDSTFTYPLVISTGKGCVLADVDGNKFLDFTSNIGSCPLGYSHPAIMDVLSKYSKSGAHKIAGQDFYCEEHAQISKKFLSILPPNFKAFFINSGAEAVENAIKIAWRKISKDTPSMLPGVSCINAFHGRTLGALSFTFSKPVQKEHYPELPALRIKFCTADDDPEIDAADKLLAQQNNNAAFIIVEVIQGEGGYNVASPQFIRNLRKTADKYGIPLILDEVQSGMGRTGKWWAFEHYGVTPDITTAAKALQVGAVGFKSSLEPEGQGALSSTWGGGARIDLAVGAAVIDSIKKDKLLANATRMGSQLVKGLRELLAEAGGERAKPQDKATVTDVRGIGLMVGVELDSKASRDSLILRLFKRGLLVLPAGQKSLRVIPPLIVGKQEINEAIQIIHDSIGS